MQHQLQTVFSISIGAVLIMLWGGISVAKAINLESFATAPDAAAKDIANAREGCSGTRLIVEPVQFSSRIKGAVLHITSSQAGCLGATGEYQLLAVKGGDGRWRNAFKAYSQTIMVDTIGRSGVASFAVRSVLGCTQSFTWSGQRYAERREVTGFGGCGNGPFPAGVHAIETALRAETSSLAGQVPAKTNVDAAQDDARLGQLGAGPVGALRSVIDHVSTLPCWCDKEFSRAVAHYATPELIRAVERGGHIAMVKQIDLWDGDFFTGQQQVKVARLISAHVIEQSVQDAIIAAEIAIIYDDGSVYPPVKRTYHMKIIDGEWRIDDIAMNGTPSTKRTFSHPEG